MGLNKPFVDFYRCPVGVAKFVAGENLSPESGFFQFDGLVCYGRAPAGYGSLEPADRLRDTVGLLRAGPSGIQIPFDLAEVVDNLRLERYMPASNGGVMRRVVRGGYYFIRPALGISTRKHLQKLFLRGWDNLPFPHWPVDSTVERIFEKLMLLALESQDCEPIPFIWFWPGGAPNCTILTHDVETAEGADFCSTLMDIDDAFGVKASFQIVPEKRYPVSEEFLDGIRQRGFEVNVQDLNHDGHLFRDRETFLSRVSSINRFVKAYRARGFRSAALYRNLDWLPELNVSYDLSVPNVAHLEAQRGGGCTVFPYFIGQLLEVPVTATQDYTVFHILHNHSLDLWKRQITLIRERHGLASFIVHPDYIISERPRKVYLSLLEYLALLRDRGETWVALPGELDTWWRQRAAMRLVRRDSQWVIEGLGSERARVAFAVREEGQLKYVVADSLAASPVV